MDSATNYIRITSAIKHDIRRPGSFLLSSDAADIDIHSSRNYNTLVVESRKVVLIWPTRWARDIVALNAAQN